jgi:AcrR family transcriptional regulator
MVERTNRRDAIVEAATRLFMGQGYAATSVRQIADEVGCTEAALYYHFKEGKRALLQAVVESNLPDLARALDALDGIDSLHDLIVRFGFTMSRTANRLMGEKLSWLLREFPSLLPEERALIYKKHQEFRKRLHEYVRPFTRSDREAEQLVWTLVFVAFGYGQLMYMLDMQSVVPFDLNVFMEDFAARLAGESDVPCA